jgi:hypothetical protein
VGFAPFGARLWSRFGMICGGRLSSFTACKRHNRRLIEHERSDRCKPRWQPPSKNGGDFVLRRPFGHQDEQAAEHIAQGDFTRQHDLHRDGLHRRLMGLDVSTFGFGFCIAQASKFHHFAWLDAITREHVGNLSGKINWQSALLKALWIFKIGITGVTDASFAILRIDSEGTAETRRFLSLVFTETVTTAPCKNFARRPCNL